MSDTPQTDAVIIIDPMNGGEEVPVIFTRQLEHELSQWRERAEELAKALEKCNQNIYVLVDEPKPVECLVRFNSLSQQQKGNE